MHFWPDAGRQKPLSTMRRWRTIHSVVEAGLARPPIERRASPAEVRRWTAAHSPVECRHAAFQLFVGLLELVDALELIDRHTEPGENANQEKGEPNLQTPADRVDNHGACLCWRPEFIQCNIPVPGGSRSDRVPAFCGC